jgi:hypothetical protein
MCRVSLGYLPSLNFPHSSQQIPAVSLRQQLGFHQQPAPEFAEDFHVMKNSKETSVHESAFNSQVDLGLVI